MMIRKTLAITWLIPTLSLAYPAFTFEQISNEYFQQVSFDKKGKPWLKIQGRSTQTKPSLNKTVLKKPHIEWQSPQGTWTVDANKADFDHHTQTINCDGDVVLTQKTAKQPTTTHYTSHITAKLPERILTTDAMVKTVQDGRTMYTKGLSLRLKKK